MKIFGAGMAGLLAASVLRRFDPVVFEYQKELPNNHAALLRFRTDAASVVTNIPFKKVQVQKAIHLNGNHYNSNLYFSNLYSQKVTGKVMGRSIKSLEPVERYIAPPNFISQMATGCKIHYNEPLTADFLEYNKNKKDPVISTIPMPMLMDMVGWKDKPEFQWSKIWSVWGKIKTPATDVYQTVYYPEPHEKAYRVSITGDTYIAEYIKPPESRGIEADARRFLWSAFGIDNVEFENLQIKEQEYGKLLPVDDRARKEFIMYMTDVYGVYSLGRFATWRQLLLDDIVSDVKQIEQLITFRDEYNRKLTGTR